MLKLLKFKKMKTLKSIVAILIASIFITNGSIAQTSSALKNNNDFSVKYTGIEGDFICFLIETKGIKAANKILKINDKVEGELYNDKLKEKMDRY
jgi:hypothetical protein